MPAVRSRPLFLTIGHALAALLLGATFALPGGGGHAAERAPPAEAKPLPAKAPPRTDGKKKKPFLNFDYIGAKPDPSMRPYSADIASQHIGTLSVEIAALAAVGITVGVNQWGWGETNFHVTKEGWFGKNTTYGGIDKLGHAWSAQVMSDYITWRLRSTGYNGDESSVTAALLTGIAFAGVELGDGFSHYGASSEDMIASASGIAFSFLRNTVPGLHDKVDFRMQYVPSGHGDFVGIGDYDGKKFLLAWKLGGFEAFKDRTAALPRNSHRLLHARLRRSDASQRRPTHPVGLCGSRVEPVGVAVLATGLCGTRRSGRPAARSTNTSSCPTPMWRATAIPGGRGAARLLAV